MLTPSALHALDDIAFQASLLALLAAVGGAAAPAATELAQLQQEIRSASASEPDRIQAAARLVEMMQSMIAPTRPLRPT